ncbi:MAG: class I SAM-dependent methyltransferase, partial [Actinomycetia bacterium]|nr:class I SAM-dependent methyltransferase [Actinomycetes bacterium]
MNATDGTVERALDSISRRLGYRSSQRYRTRAEFVFDGISLDGARVLDVGCGPGAFTLWSALMGADYVLGIEPETDGATSGTRAELDRTVKEFELDERVETRPSLLHELTAADGQFDVVVTYNVVNHLDEDAVQRLPGDPEAEKRYRAIFSHIARLMKPGGTLVIGDCARSNAWGDRGKSSPFASMIEWDKHLDPDNWTSMLVQSGFEFMDLRWSYLYPFKR